ncbi:MAG: hypothetical protein JW934_15295 [Anaerolineae bacterium]|nr:hypothetical protein [Anaerolineae bacterium]
MTKRVQKLTMPLPDPDEIIDIPTCQLLLDEENARIAWRTGSDTQEDLVKILWDQMAVDEVAWSIAQNGFFRSEPLFVIIKNIEEENPDKRRYIVIEGNRRTAAVLLLCNQALQQRIGATDLPTIDAQRCNELSQLPAIIYPSRQDLWATVGFRHINGIKPWDSFSKAKYIAEVHEAFWIPLDEIAKKIGDRHATVSRLYRGYQVLRQAESEGVFDKEDRARNRFYFSHLYTALDQREYQEFLGIRSTVSSNPNPVPPSKLEELKELMTFFYGKKSARIEPVIRTQNPDLNTLREVISKPSALSVLRTTRSLEQAHQIAIGDERRFRDALVRAKMELQNAKGTVTIGYHGEKDLYETIEAIVNLADSIRSEMKTQIEETDSQEIEQPKRSSIRRRK